LRRRRQLALDGITFAVPHGEVVGLLGANGSGKSTTLKLLMRLVFPDKGTARVLGRPLADPAWRRAVGYLPEHPYLYDCLTAAEYLDYAGRLFGLPAEVRRGRADKLLRLVGLERASHIAMRRFSKGMIQRAGLAIALVNDPELVILDEPMSGLDPLGRRMARDIILELKDRGKTVFFSTHILADAETLCDRIALLQAGRLIRTGRLDEILNLSVSHVEMLVAGIAEDALLAMSEVQARKRLGERFRLHVAEGAVGTVAIAVERAGGRILEVHPIRQSLEEYFVKEVAAAPPESRAAVVEL
jgi:ABC-2 type transport system ATP-binding protein